MARSVLLAFATLVLLRLVLLLGLVRGFFCLLFGDRLLLSRGFGLAEHISETKLTDSVAIRNLTFSLTQVTGGFEEVVFVNGHLLLGVGLAQLSQGSFS